MLGIIFSNGKKLKRDKNDFEDKTEN